MKADVAKQWAAALRSGDYEQGRDYLHRDLGTGDEWCCLGVLCDLAVKDGVEVELTSFRSEEGNECFEYNGKYCEVPYRVLDWSGLATGFGHFSEEMESFDLGDEVCSSLGEMNDRGVSFGTIADVIEKNAEKL